MYSAPLPTSRKDLADRGLQALVGVGNDQLDTTQAPLAKRRKSTQKTWASGRPAPNREFPAAVLVDAAGDYRGDRHHRPPLRTFK